jgi:hypothetical protein
VNRTTFWFESSSFPILPEEADEVNPHIHGKSLALWLGEKLRAAGYVTRAPFKEDFGWWMDVESEPPYKLMVVCAGEEPNRWCAFAGAEGGSAIGRMFGKDKRDEVAAPLQAALRKILESEPTIHALREE